MATNVEHRGKPGTRDRILDAAEALFAARGYDGVSIREVMRDAGVELGNAAYYFGKKEELLRQVIARRADDLVEDSIARLDAALAGPEKPADTLERLIAALIAPIFERLTTRGAGWRNYIRILSSLSSIDKEQTYLQSVHDYMDPTIHRFLHAIRQLFPDCPERTIYLFYYFLNSSCLHMFQETRTIDVISGGTVSTQDYDLIRHHLPRFFAAGFRAMLENS